MCSRAKYSRPKYVQHDLSMGWANTQGSCMSNMIYVWVGLILKTQVYQTCPQYGWANTQDSCMANMIYALLGLIA